jgi:hypothetical protein
MELAAEWSGGTSVGAVTFQSMRATEAGVQVAPAPWCKIATLADEFTGNTFGPQWFGFPQNPGCSLYVFGDRAHFDHGGAGACSTALLSRPLYDLSDSELVVRVDPIAMTPPDWLGTIAVADPIDHRISVTARENQLCGSLSFFPGDGCVPYAGQLYWRIRADGGVVTWDVSADAASWTVLRSEPTPAVDIYRVRVGLGASGGVGPAFQFAIDAIGPP